MASSLIGSRSLICEICGDASSKNDKEFLEHMEGHDVKKCVFCREIFNSESVLTTHMKIHKEKKYWCHICNKKFIEEICFQDHYKKHFVPSTIPLPEIVPEPPGPAPKPHPELQLDHESILQQMDEPSSHLAPEPFNELFPELPDLSGLPDLPFSSTEAIVNAARSESDPWTLSLVQQTSNVPSPKKKSIDQSDKGSTSYYEGSEQTRSPQKKCINRFVKPYAFSKSSKYYTCDICDKTCGTKEDLLYHKRYEHSQGSGGSSSSKRKNLRMKSPDDDDEDDKDCDDDDDDDDDDEGNKVQQETFRCTLCNKLFPFQSALADHRTSHSNNYYFPCNKCPKVFSDINQLSDHIEVHESEPPFKCALCHIFLADFVTLTCHLVSHIRNGRVLCLVCDIDFDTLSEFKEHTKIHRERPYECLFCHQKFSDNSSCKQHLKSHYS